MSATGVLRFDAVGIKAGASVAKQNTAPSASQVNVDGKVKKVLVTSSEFAKR